MAKPIEPNRLSDAHHERGRDLWTLPQRVIPVAGKSLLQAGNRGGPAPTREVSQKAL